MDWEEFKEFMSKYKKVFITILCVIFALIIVFNSIGSVPVNHTGILKRFGVVQNISVPEGVRLKIPFVDELESISNMVQTSTVIASQTNAKATTTETAYRVSLSCC